MTKNQLVFSIMEVIRGQAATDDSAKFVHPQDVEFQVGMAYEKSVIDFFMNPDLAKFYDLDYFTKTYTAKIKQDAAGRLYVTIPAQPIAASRAQGIKSVIPENSDTQIVRITEAEWMTLVHLEAFCCSPWPFCYVDFYDKKIILQGNRAEYNLLDNVKIKIIPKFTEYADTDEINSPTGDYSLTQMVMQNMGLRPTDNTNDNIR